MAAKPAPSRAAPQVLLIYGNQAYGVDHAAAAYGDLVLGEGPRDFSLQRFDAAELLKAGGGEAVLARVEGFHEACMSAPLLSERYLVRLDHLEAVRLPDRSAQALLRSLEELRLRRVEDGGGEAWRAATEADGAAPGALPLSRWIAGVSPRAAGGPLVELAPGADEVTIVADEEGARLGVRAFLRRRVKTKFAFSDEAEPPAEGAEGTAAAGTSSGAARLHQILERVLDNPPPGLSLLLTADCTREADLSKELLERVRRLGRLDKHVLYADQAPVEWLLGMGRERKLALSPYAAELLIQRVGNDMGRLVQELDRLQLLALPGQTVSEEALLDTVRLEQQGSVFTLAECAAARDLAGALGVLERILSDSAHEYPMMIAVLARHFRQLRQVHLAREDNASDSELAQRLKVHPFLAKRLATQAQRFSRLELERIQRSLSELDLAARRQGPVMRVLLQDVLQRICQGAFRGRAVRG
jgi:DNA polymerase III delta subunit